MRFCVPAAVAITMAIAACASGGSSASSGAGNSGVRRTPQSAPSRQANILDSAEIHRQYWATAYDLVSARRQRWLYPRGQDSFVVPTEVQVLLNGVRMGGPDNLKQIPAVDIIYVEYFDPVTAAARWGQGFGNGAIYVSTQRRQPPQL